MRHFWILVTLCFILGLMAGFQNLTTQQRFTDNGDGTVTDHHLQLMWAKRDNLGDINWRQANKWVKYTFPLMIGSQYDDWRLPTPAELSTLYIKSETGKPVPSDCGVAIKIIPQIIISCGWVWSSEQKDISATVFCFNNGYPFSDLKMRSKAHRVLAVRSLTPSPAKSPDG